MCHIAITTRSNFLMEAMSWGRCSLKASERPCCNCQLSIRYRGAPQKLRSTEAHRYQRLDLALELPAESLRRALRNILSRCELGPDGSDPLSDEDVATGCCRDGPART